MISSGMTACVAIWRKVVLTLVEVTAAEILPFVRLAADRGSEPWECVDAIAGRSSSMTALAPCAATRSRCRGGR